YNAGATAIENAFYLHYFVGRSANHHIKPCLTGCRDLRVAIQPVAKHRSTVAGDIEPGKRHTFISTQRTKFIVKNGIDHEAQYTYSKRIPAFVNQIPCLDR